MIGSYECVLLDVDGVLVDSVGFYVKLIRGVAESLGAHLDLDDSFYRSKLGVEFDLWMAKIVPEANHHRMASLLEERNPDVSDGSLFPLMEGTKELLARLRDTNKKVGFVSTKTRRAMEAMLDAHGLRDWVDFTICGDEVERYKPNPEGINKAIEFFGVLREQTIFVGDSSHDAGAARNAGVAFIGVTTGVCSKADWANERVRHVNSLRDLLPVRPH